MNEKIIKNLEELRDSLILKSVIKESLWEIKLTKKSLPQYIIAGVIATLLSYYVVFKGRPVVSMRGAVEIINNSILAFIAIIFGTYAIFQALMTDSVVLALLNSESNILNISNKSFLHLVILYIWEIIMNMLLLILLNIMHDDFCLFQNLALCNSIALIACFFYFVYSFLIIYEIKNFAINLYRMFSVYNIYHSIEVLEKHDLQDKME